MIKELDNSQLDEVMTIWLETNVTAHSFIPEKYWQNNYNVVKEQYMPIAKSFVYQDVNEIKAFISVIDNSFIGALFVEKKHQGQGIGLKLINHCKALYPKLELFVYVENVQAVNFYKKCGFKIIAEKTDEDSGYQEYLMSWTNEK